jgi:hypothetical protein
MPTYLMQAHREGQVDPLAHESYRIDQTTGLIDDSIDESMVAGVEAPSQQRRLRGRFGSTLTTLPLLAMGPFLLLASVFVNGEDSR